METNMNERIINELVEMAITQNEPGWPQFRKSLTGSGALYLDVFAEKFAELIVRECMKMNHEHFSDEDPYSIDSLYRQHFGFQ